MAQAMIQRGYRRKVLDSASRAAGTYASDEYQLVGANAIIITISVTDAGAAGSLDTVNILSPDGDILIQFATQSITAAGNYNYRIAPGATVAAGSNAYKGVSSNLLPAVGQVQVVHTVNAMVYSIKVEAVGF